MLLLAGLTIRTPYRDWLRKFASDNWGSIAGVWGLEVSICVLFVAEGARAAAREARSGEKAKSALEDLKHAAEKNTQIAAYARSAKWDAVRIRAEEVMNYCHHTVARWKDDSAFEESSNDLLRVAEQMRSTIQQADKPNPSAKGILDSQATSSEKLSTVTGRIERKQDSRSK